MKAKILTYAKSDLKSKHVHFAHFCGLFGLCSSWVCPHLNLEKINKMEYLHFGLQVLISKSFLLGSHHIPHSSGLDGINL